MNAIRRGVALQACLPAAIAGAQGNVAPSDVTVPTRGYDVRVQDFNHQQNGT